MAALMLGRYLRKGLAGPPDPEQAAHWLREARKRGIAEADVDLEALGLAPAPATPPVADNTYPFRAAGD
jgi:TPR repeat protein